MENSLMWFVLIFMVGMGIADIYLLITKRNTISQCYHRLFPQWVDIIVMVSVLAIVWMFLGMAVFTIMMSGTILGHLAWHGDK